MASSTGDCILPFFRVHTSPGFEPALPVFLFLPTFLYKPEQRRRELKSSLQQDFPDVMWIFESGDLLAFETQTKRVFYFFHKTLFDNTH